MVKGFELDPDYEPLIELDLKLSKVLVTDDSVPANAPQRKTYSAFQKWV